MKSGPIEGKALLLLAAASSSAPVGALRFIFELKVQPSNSIGTL